MTPSLPVGPVPVDHHILEQTAELLELLEQWLTRAHRDAAADCAHTCSRGATDDPDDVAAAVGLLADQLYTRLAKVPKSWS